ncbi:MAG: sugar ABC transporter substrate-binding protein [Bacillota bacterium]|nr:sugar ABC transporter substrate-binding protein [Bacillota bacterium]
MKKAISLLLAGLMTTVFFTGCKSTSPATSDATPTSLNTSDIKDGKFVTTKHIKVEVYDRANTGGSKPENNYYTQWIHDQMLALHNVDVTFVPVPRWTETDQINNLLAAGTAPDVCVTYSYPTIQTYANMSGVYDLNADLKKYEKWLPNLYGFLGKDNLYYDQDPSAGNVWAIEAKLVNNSRINTFVRQDWLTKLNIKAPTTTAEFETMLKAFKDNASTLLGANAAKMVPFSISYDVGWRAATLLDSFVPDNITDKDLYINGFDDRHLLLPGNKQGIKVLNTWYNEGLIWKDFALYPAGDKTEDNMIKAGYVGAFTHNFDYPYRDGDNGITASLHKLVGPDAQYVAIDPFKDDAGKTRKFVSAPIDRKVFFPSTNKEPLASELYLDFISSPDTLKFLQFGDEGVTHVTQADGSFKTIAATGDKIMNSGNNIDYTITANGLVKDGKLDVKSLAVGYAGVDSSLIQKSYDTAQTNTRVSPHFNVGQIQAETGVGQALNTKRDTMWDQAVVAAPDKFDSVYDNGLKDYLSSGGQAIIDERKAAIAKLK